MKIVILTYHSHHVLGPHYQNNDHVAFPIDLDLITDAGYRIVSLEKIVSALEPHRDRDPAEDEENIRYVGLMFDDGPVFDIEDFTRPLYGLQRSFLGAMGDFMTTLAGRNQPDLNATSVVIASPDARRVIESTYDAEYTFLLPGSLGDDWWTAAISSGLIDIGNHSWDHLHPALPDVAHSEQARGDFRKVIAVEDADRQILQAAQYITERTHGKSGAFLCASVWSPQ